MSGYSARMEAEPYIKPTQHCTADDCPYMHSHTASWCNYRQLRRCRCPYDYPALPPQEPPASSLPAPFPFSPEDWETIFSMVPQYPTELPDEVRRIIAELAIMVREAAGHLERGRRINSTLDYLMPLSLIGGALKRLEQYAP